MSFLFADARREFIARPDPAKSQILFKWPDSNIRLLSVVTVEQDEQAIFFRDGRVFGKLAPGVHTLDSRDLPFLGDLVDQLTGGKALKAELYFVGTREFPNLPFGGVVDNVADAQTNLAVGLRVFGDYSLQVCDPEALIVHLVGTQNLADNDAITDWMREQLLKVFRTDVVTHVVSQGWPILGIASHNTEIEREILAHVQPQIRTYGVEVARMGNFTISLKPEDEERLKHFIESREYTKQVAGDYVRYSVGTALQGEGQGAAAGAAGSAAASAPVLGLGMGLAGMAAGAAGQAIQSPAQVQVRCLRCGALNAESARFCNGCGQALAPAAGAEPAASSTTACPGCAAQNAVTARFCSNCGQSLTPNP